jgi:hypothetical protein
MGSRAPFHSQKQNMPTTTKPESSGARTIEDFHGKITPPWRAYVKNAADETDDDKQEHTQMRGNISSVQPARVNSVPR